MFRLFLNNYVNKHLESKKVFDYLKLLRFINFTAVLDNKKVLQSMGQMAVKSWLILTIFIN